jgi:hypothetical protein
MKSGDGKKIANDYKHAKIPRWLDFGLAKLKEYLVR